MKRILRLPKPVLAVALSCALLAGACTASQISAYINLAAQIALNVLTITSAFSGTPISAHDTQLVDQFAAVLQNSVTTFEANRTAGNSTLASIAGSAETNLTAWIAAAQFNNPQLSARIQAAATSFLTIVESIAAIAAPATVVPPAPAPVAMHAGGTFSVPPRSKMSIANIKNQWNQAVCAGASTACLVH